MDGENERIEKTRVWTKGAAIPHIYIHTFFSTFSFYHTFPLCLPLVSAPLSASRPQPSPSLAPFPLFLARLQASHRPLALVHTFHFPFICSPCIHPSLLPAPSSTIITFVPVKRQQTPRSFIFLSFYPPTLKILPVSPPQPPPTSLPPIHLRFQLLPFQPLTPFSTLCSVSDKPIYAPHCKVAGLRTSLPRRPRDCPLLSRVDIYLSPSCLTFLPN